MIPTLLNRGYRGMTSSTHMRRLQGCASTGAACAKAWTSCSSGQCCGCPSRPCRSRRVRSALCTPHSEAAVAYVMDVAACGIARQCRCAGPDDPRLLRSCSAHFPAPTTVPHMTHPWGAADPLTAAAGGKAAPGMPRITSHARLDEEGGTRRELLAGFLAKAAALGVVVTLLTRYQTPRLLTEILYGAPPPPGPAQQAVGQGLFHAGEGCIVCKSIENNSVCVSHVCCKLQAGGVGLCQSAHGRGTEALEVRTPSNRLREQKHTHARPYKRSGCTRAQPCCAQWLLQRWACTPSLGCSWTAPRAWPAA